MSLIELRNSLAALVEDLRAAADNAEDLPRVLREKAAELEVTVQKLDDLIGVPDTK